MCVHALSSVVGLLQQRRAYKFPCKLRGKGRDGVVREGEDSQKPRDECWPGKS